MWFMPFFYYMGNCAQRARIFACKIKFYPLVPPKIGDEGVDVLKTLFYLHAVIFYDIIYHIDFWRCEND